MTSTRYPTAAADWCERIEGISSDRCDLDVLLKDEWRHKVAVRDDGRGARATKQQKHIIRGQGYAALKNVLRDNNCVSLGALVLATLHSVLHAYGHGNQTVVAFVNATETHNLQYAGVLPVIVDHIEQSGLTCLVATERIEETLRRKDSYLSPAELLQRGLFDASLVLAAHDVTLADLPPFPLVTVVRDIETNRCLQWTMSYAEDLFEDKVIVGVLDVVREVFGQFISRPTRLVADIELVSEEQKLQLHQWNATDGDFPETKRLNELFEDAMQRSPEREAVVFGNTRLTYRELNDRANQIAHWLLGPAVRVRPQQLVALYLDKSDLGVATILGIWKSGAAYVPIDPTYPVDRIRFLVRDTQVSWIITNQHHAARLREILGSQHAAVHVIEVETVLLAQGSAGNVVADNPELALSSQDLAYVTYTSGTTGVPKGVPKDHYSVVNSITDLSERYDMRRPGEERVALFASYVFEPHMRQILIALINSQTLVVVPEEIRLDPDRFPAFIERHGVTYLNVTGSVLQHFDLRRCSSLKKILLVGEELTAAGLRQLREKFSGRVINEYAFTEAAFVTAIKEFAPGLVERRDRSIGRPLRNVKWYVLSQNLKQLPLGAIGELYIGGCGVARGYLNRDDLTAERFVANPFQSTQEKMRGKNDLLYKTGDLARALSNGEVEYMGRSDFQLKLNGVRVEPGEIEAQATEFPGVKKCVVVAREGAGGASDRHLVGYFVADASTEVTEADLLAFLEKRLIRVMVPARMVRLSAIPVNVNGKVDWRALPEVGVHDSNRTHTSTDSASVAPSNNRPTGVAGSILDDLRDIWSTVLGVPTTRIDNRDDFFRLGGQSISCILLIARVRQRLGLTVDVEDIFKLRTLGNLAYYLEQQQAQGPQPVLEPVIEEASTGGQTVRLLANGLQQGLLYHSLKSTNGDDAYVMQSVHRYRCCIRPNLMEHAWQHAWRKHPCLRLRFEWGEDPLQIVDNDDKPFNWRFVDLSTLADAGEQEACVKELQERDRTEPYEPTDGQLFRVYLIKHRDDLFSLIFSCHHIILDGWSLPVLHDDVHRMYLHLVQGFAVEPVEDSSYMAAQRYWEAHRNDHVEYWMKQIDRIDERGDFGGLLNEQSRYQTELSTYDHVRQHKTKKLCIGTEKTAALAAACAANRVTLHSVLQFVWHKVLYAIGGGRTTVVGTIVSGRNLPIDGIETSVGLFINTLPLIVDHDDQATKSVAVAVMDIQSAVNTMNSKSTVELGRLQSGEMKRRLFDTLLVLENYPRLLDEVDERQHRELLRFEKAYDADKVDYPLAVVAREEDDELTINLWYAGELFDDTTIDTLLDMTHALFCQVADNISQPVSDLELVSPAMVASFNAWNCTEAEFPSDKTLHGVFEEVAAGWPSEVAVVYGRVRLTYRELNERANQLAHYLRSVVQLQPNDLIALVLDKSEMMIVAIVAVWKAGAAYVPIDPRYPDERIVFMLADTQARLVLANEAYSARLRALSNVPTQRVLDIEQLRLDDQPRQNPLTPATSTDLAYAIYTSGTTGKPKAVLVEHRGVVNLQSSMTKLFSLRKGDADEAILSFSNYVFDHFVEQMTDALLNGQKLIVLDEEMRADESLLCEYINDQKVTYLSGTPSVLSLYDFSTATSLTRIDAIGEDFSEPVFDKIRRTFKGIIINGYGPTEISITSHKRLYGENERRVNKSIGYPVANTKCYVLNKAMKRVPIGGIGELYIGGIGVARGYLNRDELTADRFLSNPFQTPNEKRLGKNARMYKTGDLVRWLPTGELECLGRTDLQVKIRGQRVELGEIEAVLSSYPGVTRSLVISREHRTTASAASQKYLVGFYVCDRELDEQDVKQWMRKKLPEAVVPARVLRINDVPVTSSGKLDTRRLPEIDFGSGSGIAYVAPANDVEIKLCGIWSKVLDVAPDLISVHDDFFALGGDSIRAMTLAQKITISFGHGLSVATVLKHTTLAAQAKHIQENAVSRDDENVDSAAGCAAVRADHPPVSLAQERLLFIDDFEGGTAAYNIPFVVQITTNAVVSQDAIIRALRTLLRRHLALRTLLRAESDGARRQYTLSEEDALAMFDIAVHLVDSAAELDKMLLDRAEHRFCLHEELPIRAALFELVAVHNNVYVSVVVHHSCFDGWSWDIFRRELAALVEGVPEAELGAIRGSYADFAVWQRQYLTGHRLSTLTEFWTRALAGFETIRLPLDKPRPPRFDYRGRELLFDLDVQTTEALRALAQDARVSLYSVLLGAWCLMLSMYTGQHDLIVGTPSANRGRPEFDRAIGFFANLLVLRIRVDSGATVMDYVRSVGAVVLAAQIHGELPFEQLVKELGVEKDPSRHPVVQVNFTLQNVTDRAQHASAAPTERPALNDYKPHSGRWTSAKFDLSATLSETSDGLEGNLTFAASLFTETSASGFVFTFKHILTEFARLSSAGDRAHIADITCTDESGQMALLASAGGDVAAPASDASHSRLLHGVFEEVAASWPSEVAVVYGRVRLTYRELNERANQLAHYLRSVVQLQPNDLIALVLDKSEMMIVAIVAVWKAGAAYVPIDPRYPDERVAFMLADTQARLVLANEAYSARLRALSNVPTQRVLDIEQLRLDDQPRQNPLTPATSTDLAYAIYTSGTTGKPKAVLVSHHSVASFREQLSGRYFGPPTETRQGILFLANYVFDFSVEQLVLSILGGNKLIIPPPSLAHDDHDFYEHANHERLTYLSSTPTQVQQFNLSRLVHLRCVLVAGEPFQVHHFEKIRREFAGPIINAYGTTETTVYNMIRRFELGEGYRNSLGEPLGNTRLYVLGDTLKLLPSGAVGELYMAGECVSGGYLNQPELTRERFLANPFQTDAFQTDAERRHKRFPVLYKTGDIVRRSSDGEIQYMGRNDTQVKIHGLRIEPGEVEAALASCPGVRQCAVIACADERSPDSKRLVGYYVADDSATVDEDGIFAALRAKLLPSMVPSLLLRLDRPLPMTINGKLDTDALPHVDFSPKRVAYAAPRNRMEARLCHLWSAQLPGGSVGIDDDFFRSGGDSIRALHLASQVQREVNHKVSVKYIFDFPTVRLFVDNVLSRSEGGYRTTDDKRGEPERGRMSGECPMLPIQEWFFAKPLTDRNYWNQNFAIRTPPLETEKLRNALDRLVEHHDAFRLRYPTLASDTSKIKQIYSDGPSGIVLNELDVRHLQSEDVKRHLMEWQSNFDLERGPTSCAAYLYGFDDGTARVWFAMHHLMIDTVSWRILSQDLEILYHGGDLEQKTSSYRQWAQAVRNYIRHEDERQFWTEITQDMVSTASDELLAVTNDTATRRIEFALSASDTQTLLTESHWAYDTDINDLLLTAIGFALRSITQRAKNYITVEGHGRELFEGAPDVRDTVGWFTTMHPFAVKVYHQDLGRSILRTQESRRRVPHHGVGYGALLGRYGGEGAPLPLVSFNYLGRLIDDDVEHAPDQSAGWRLDSAMSGSSRADSNKETNQFSVDVTMSCICGRFLTVVDSRLSGAATQRFTSELKVWLEQLIAHTSSVVRNKKGRAKGGPQGAKSEDFFDPYILVNEKGAGRTVFVLPPGEGGAESYLNNIAQRLPGHRLALFNNMHTHSREESFEALARYYVEHVRRLQPSGPYSFLGWSFGGVLALEMALQLARAGEEIDNLLLIDSYFNVRQASASIGLPDVDNILDPINYYYLPSRIDLARLRAHTGNLVMFKAGELNDIIRGDDQRRLFEFYLRSPYNNLDTLLAAESIEIYLLEGETHHSWVQNERLVAAVCTRVLELLSGQPASVHAARKRALTGKNKTLEETNQIKTTRRESGDQ